MRKTSDGATLVQFLVTIFLNVRAQCAVVPHRSCILEVSAPWGPKPRQVSRAS